MFALLYAKGRIYLPTSLFFLCLLLSRFGLWRFFVLHALRIRAVPTLFGFIVPHFVTASNAVFFPCHD
jgi:hypothetical protein